VGALSGNASYLRFFVDGEAPEAIGDVFEQAVEARRFTPLVDKGEDLETGGWVPIEDPFDDELPITRDRFHFGDFIALTYREDSFSFPRPLVQRRVKKKLEELAEKGEKVNKGKKKQAELAVLSELKKKMLPRPRVMDVVWDMPRRELRVFGRGPMGKERATACFERTFAVRLQHATWAARAFSLDLSGRARSVLEQLAPEFVFEDVAWHVQHDDEENAG
jgi:hypothetical protein